MFFYQCQAGVLRGSGMYNLAPYSDKESRNRWYSQHTHQRLKNQQEKQTTDLIQENEGCYLSILAGHAPSTL